MRKWSQGKVICPGFHTKLLKIQNLLSPSLWQFLLHPICLSQKRDFLELVLTQKLSYLLFFLSFLLFLFPFLPSVSQKWDPVLYMTNNNERLSQPLNNFMLSLNYFDNFQFIFFSNLRGLAEELIMFSIYQHFLFLGNV